jgi:hypothetical protein
LLCHAVLLDLLRDPDLIIAGVVVAALELFRYRRSDRRRRSCSRLPAGPAVSITTVSRISPVGELHVSLANVSTIDVSSVSPIGVSLVSILQTSVIFLSVVVAESLLDLLLKPDIVNCSCVVCRRSPSISPACCHGCYLANRFEVAPALSSPLLCLMGVYSVAPLSLKLLSLPHQSLLHHPTVHNVSRY